MILFPLYSPLPGSAILFFLEGFGQENVAASKTLAHEARPLLSPSQAGNMLTHHNFKSVTEEV